MPSVAPDDLDPVARARFFTALVAPRPIAFVSTCDREGRVNLAPYSFFMAGGYAPLSVCFSPVALADGGPKDTLRNIQETGEFVVNVATRAIAAPLNQASYGYAYGESEFAQVGLTPVPSQRVRPPRVRESPAALECRVHTIVPHGTGVGSANYVIGEVVHLWVDDDVFTDGLPDNRKIAHLSRLGAQDFSAITPDSLFQMRRPEAP